MSASIGISIYPDNATDIDTLIQQADAAMYKAKQAGRSTYRFFSADMDRLAEQRLAYSAALRAALANDGLTLHYQPQIRTGRWRHPRRRGAGALARSGARRGFARKIHPAGRRVRADRADRPVVDPRGLPANGAVA